MPTTIYITRRLELPDPIPATPERIRAMMRKWDLSEAELARLVGVGREQVACWLVGIRRPRGTSTLLLTLLEERGPIAIEAAGAGLRCGLLGRAGAASARDRAEMLAPWIAELRRQEGLTGADLGRLLGITPATVSIWESAGSGPGRSAIILMEMVRLYGVESVVPRGPRAEVDGNA